MSSNPDSANPTGRKIPAQDKNPVVAREASLAHASQNTSSPERAKDSGELPDGWRWVNLPDIGELSRGKSKHRPRNEPKLYGGPHPFIQTGDIRESGGTIRKHTQTYSELGLSQSKLWPSGTLCITIAANIGETGILTYPACFPDSVVGFRHDGDPVTVRFVELYFRIAKAALERLAPATAQKNINVDILSKLQIPLPPLPEQRRIVAEIEKQFTRLEAGVAALRRVQANLKRYRAAVLKAACEGRLVPTEAELARSKPPTKNGQPAYETGEALLARILTERHQNWQGRGRYKEPAAPDVAKLPPLPEGWKWSALAQLAAHITDGTHKTPTYLDSGVPFLSAKDISGFRLSFDKCRFISPSEHGELSRRCAVRRGNVLITKSGTIGRVAVVLTDDEFSLFESVANVPVLPPIEPNFLSIAAFVGIAGAFGAANQKGVAVRHLHLEDLRRVPIPLPPLAEQTRIVAEVERRLSVVVELESVVSDNLQRAKRLRQSILQKAFSGEL